jgi:hypothetical protein
LVPSVLYLLLELFTDVFSTEKLLTGFLNAEIPLGVFPTQCTMHSVLSPLHRAVSAESSITVDQSKESASREVRFAYFLSAFAIVKLDNQLLRLLGPC